MCPTPVFSANSKRDELFLSLWTVYLGSRAPTYAFLDSTYKRHHILLPLSLLLHLLWSSLSSCLCLNTALSILPYSWFICHCVYRTHFLCSFLCPCPLRLQQFPSFGSWSGRDGRGTLVFGNFPACLPRHVISVSPGSSMFRFLKILHIVLSTGRTNGDFE